MTYTTTKMFFNGRVNLPETFLIPYKNMQVLYGKDNYTQLVNEVNGEFWVRLNAVGTSLLLLQTRFEDDATHVPMLMTVFPTFGENYLRRNTIEFSFRETAVALVFIQPGIAVTVNPFYNAALLERIRNLPATKYLARVLEDKMTLMSPSVIVSGDVDIQNVIAAAVNELYSEIGIEEQKTPLLAADATSDDQTSSFYHVPFKEVLIPNKDEVDNVYIKYYNEDGPQVKAYNNMPRWVFYFVDSMPVEAVLPDDVPDTGIDEEADPSIAVPPKHYASPKLRFLVSKYVNANDEYFRKTVLVEGVANSIVAEINNYFDMSPVTEKTSLRFKKKPIEQGFLVGYTLSPDLGSMEGRAFDSLWATYFAQLYMPLVQLSGDINDSFKDAVINFDQVTNKPIAEHPVYMIARNIRERGIGMRVNDFMLQRSASANSNGYKLDLYEKVMDVFLNSFLGTTSTSKAFLAEVKARTQSASYALQLNKVADLIYSRVVPPDVVTHFRGMDVPILEFHDAVFSTKTGRDIYYFNEEDIEQNDGGDTEIVIPYPIDETTVFPEGVHTCDQAGNDKPGCMVFINAAGRAFSMGNDGQDGWFGSLAYESEKPMHRVTMAKSYYIDKYEVSVAQYKAFLNDPKNKAWLPQYAMRGKDKCWGDKNYLIEWSTQNNYMKGGKDLFPVSNICWYAADAYCKWAGKRLANEEEWEFAARADENCITKEEACRNYPWGNETLFNSGNTPFSANFRNSYDPYEPSRLMKDKVDPDDLKLIYPEPHLTPVGYFNGTEHPQFKSKNGISPFGIHDMAGNVEEWVATRFYYYKDLQEGGIPTPVGDQRVVRGGSWSTTRHLIRSSYRHGVNPENNSNAIGFRCAKDAN